MNNTLNTKNKILATIRKLSSARTLLPKKLKSYKLQASLRGFTLIETLVAISILMIAVASPLTIAQKGLSSAIYAKDQVIASYLAQDAIEYLRNLSDQNVANGVGWLNGISENSNCGTLCTVDTTTTAGIASCTDSTSDLVCDNNPLYYDDFLYKQTGTTLSPFTRSVKVEETVTDKEALITVTVSWMDKGKPRTITVNTRIFNWR